MLQTRYIVQDTPVTVVEFYRRELPTQGWQEEVPPITAQSVNPLRDPLAEKPSLYTAFVSFVKGDLRVAVLAGPNEKDPSLGATVIDVSVERRGPFAEVTADLNIRSLPTTESEIVGTLKKGDKVELLRQELGEEAEPGSGNQTWYRIAQGYIYSAYVTKP